MSHVHSLQYFWSTPLCWCYNECSSSPILTVLSSALYSPPKDLSPTLPLYNLETVQIPTPKLYIFVFLMIRHIQWHQLGFIKGLISQKLFRFPSLTIYIGVPYDKTDPVTLPGDLPPPPPPTNPPRFIKGLISQKLFISPPLNYIYLCLYDKMIQWHWLGVLLVACPSPSISLKI